MRWETGSSGMKPRVARGQNPDDPGAVLEHTAPIARLGGGRSAGDVGEEPRCDPSPYEELRE